LLVEPFQTFYASLVRHLYEADAILIGGYGFGDTHVNGALQNRLQSSGSRPPVVVLTWPPTVDPMDFRQDAWSHALTIALYAPTGYRAPGHPGAPPIIPKLVELGGFEVSAAHRVAIWHGGYAEAEARLDSIIRWLAETADDTVLRPTVGEQLGVARGLGRSRLGTEEYDGRPLKCRVGRPTILRSLRSRCPLMAGYRPTQIRKPSNETEFEKNCVVLFREFLRDPNVKRLGTRGQRQHGVDLVGHRNRDPKEIVGIQCKLKSGAKKLTKKEVQKEVKAALGYKPPLREYFIVTTSKDDTTLDQYAQQLMQEQEVRGRRIQIEIWGWDTLEEKIGEYEAAKNAFDPGFSPSVASQGRKIDALLIAQKKQATQSQVTALIAAAERDARGESTRLPAKYAHRELQDELSKVLRRRGFARTDTAAELAALANRAIDGDLALGSTIIRSEICDRAARANASHDTLDAARRFRENAALFDPSCDLFIADAVLKEAAGDPNATLRDLKTRTDPDTRSALLTTLIRQRGKEAALDWVRAEKLRPADFNAPGALNLILKQIESGDFDQALIHVLETPSLYFTQCPALLLLRGQLTIASILPMDQKPSIFQGLPLNPRMLQLASGPSRQRIITSTDRDFTTLLGLVPELRIEFLEDFLSEMDLWLRLENYATEQTARDQLAREIADPAKTLQRVRLALAYDVPFNTQALQRNLASRQGLGGWNPDERFAAFLIVLNTNDPDRLTDFFERYHEDLFAQSHLVRAALAIIEIEALARTGRFDQVRAHIELHHRAKHLTDEKITEIRQIVAHIEAGDEVEHLRQRYAASGHLSDLRPLIHGLRARRDDKQLAVYAPILARATKTQEDFDLAVKSLFRAGRYADVIAFTQELPEIFALDNEYTALKGWSFYRLGRVMEARGLARDLLSRRDFAADRQLAVNTAIESGDWGNLHAILSREAERADALPVGDLLRLARLALEVGSAYVHRFRDAALRKAPDDRRINGSRRRCGYPGRRGRYDLCPCDSLLRTPQVGTNASRTSTKCFATPRLLCLLLATRFAARSRTLRSDRRFVIPTLTTIACAIPCLLFSVCNLSGNCRRCVL
jgi:hypothetical protein